MFLVDRGGWTESSHKIALISASWLKRLGADCQSLYSSLLSSEPKVKGYIGKHFNVDRHYSGFPVHQGVDVGERVLAKESVVGVYHR